MKLYKCNECDEIIKGDVITLRGLGSLRGGILLPDRFMRFDYCSQQCFWRWVQREIGAPLEARQLGDTA